ncbi:MAG TPA: hypothetical protein VKE74_11065, partial [Gemmataceae bacterium]|nr:hypothetical protein [Gemmataceae bacterium]
VWPTRSRAPTLSPTRVIPVSQPQPDALLPPFAVLPGGTKLLVRGQKSRIELRDLATGAVLTVWRWGLPRVLAVCTAADGLTAAAAGDRGRVVIWDLE